MKKQTAIKYAEKLNDMHMCDRFRAERDCGKWHVYDTLTCTAYVEVETLKKYTVKGV